MSPDKHDEMAQALTRDIGIGTIAAHAAFDARIAAALRQLGAETIERCAKVAEGQGVSHICVAIARAIRALKEGGR